MIGIQYNVTLQQEALESLDLHQRRYKSLIEAGASHVWQMSALGELESVDPSWMELAGLQPTQSTPSWATIRSALEPEAVEVFHSRWAEALKYTRSFEVVYKLPAKSSSPRWFQDQINPILDDDGNVLEWFGFSRDITALKNAEQNLDRIIQSAPIGMLVVDREGNIKMANAQASQLFGYSVKALEGMTIETLVPESFRKKHFHLRSAYSVSPTARRMGENREVRGVRKDGTQFDAEIGLSMFGEDTNLRVVAAINDTTELNNALKVIERAAYQDRRTGLLSREGFHRQLQHWIDHSGWQTRAMVLTVDVPGHRDVNDAFGFTIGNLLLTQFGKRLEEQVGEQGLVGRIGGHEFSVFLMPDQDESPIISLERLRNALATPFKLNGGNIEMHFRLGYTLFGDFQRPVTDLLHEAERALSQHRKQTSLPWVAYNDRIHEEARQRIELTSELRQALNEDQFELHFQPKVNLVTGALVACESLIRWNHPQRGLVSPGVFIPIAEQSQLIVPIGDWVLRRACQHLRAWRDAGLKPVRVAVNVSVVQFQLADFASRVRTILDESGVAPEELALEITESVFERESDGLLKQMCALRDMGVWLSLDDFGTGYSSLLYLQQYPFDEIKIDQGFVFRMLDDPFSCNIVETVIKLAKVLNAEIIAEGIESAAVSDALVEMGCPFGQGYFYSVPLEAEDFRWLLEQRSTLPINADTSH